MNKKQPAFMMTLLAAIFFTPLLAAWLAYSKGLFLSGKMVNHGVLITPPFSLSSLALKDTTFHRDAASLLKGKWTLVYITDNPEGESSQKKLYYMRQIRQATGKDRERIERAIISINSMPNLDQWLQAHFPGTYHFVISHEKLTELKAKSPKTLALEKGSLYLVDPFGNIILFYARDILPKGIFKDLQRVLKVSQIG
jgi:hypothetical protein